MAYKGKVDLKTAHPSSPFAGPQLSFGAQPRPTLPGELSAQDKALLDWAKQQPPVKRGTVEESLMRWLESQEPTAGTSGGRINPERTNGVVGMASSTTDTKVDLVKMWNLPPSSDAHKNPRPLVDSDIFSAAQEIGWAIPRLAPVLWESQRLKEQHSQTPFYAQQVAREGARVWLELSQSYQGTV